MDNGSPDRGGPAGAAFEPAASGADPATWGREPDRSPEAIQPHGALLAVREDDLEIVHASANVCAFLGRPLDETLGASLADLIDAASIARLRDACSACSPLHCNPVCLTAAGRTFDAVLHRSGQLLVVELEPRAEEAEAHCPHAEVRQALGRLQTARSQDELWRVGAEEMRRLTGFHRVMVYRFDERDSHGEVVAESLDPEVGREAYLGIHFPASVIPAEARALYAVNWVRLVADVSYRPSPVLPAVSPHTGEPLDTSRATLRGVPPAHLSYLRDMGVSASMLISMMQAGRLWGLFTCHHYEPRLVPFRTRLLCELLAQVCSGLLAPLEREEAATHRASAGEVRAALLTRLAGEEDVHRALLGGEPSLLDLVEAGGAAIAYDGRLTTRGATPDRAQIDAVIEHLREAASEAVEDGVFATDALPSVLPQVAGLAERGAGVLAIPLCRGRSEYVLWFRPEEVRTVRWGGAPDGSAAEDPERLRASPRRPFPAWEQTVVGEARPWAPWEIAAARDLRAVLAGVILEKAGRIAALNARLQAAVRSRDDFLSVASHELRTPVTTLGLQLESLRRGLARGDLALERQLGRLDMALKQTRRLDHLVSELLDITRMTAGRLSLNVTHVDLGAVARAVVERFEDAARAAGTPITLSAPAPVCGRWDELRMDQVLTNLLSNAIKYGRGQPVDVRVGVERDRAVVRVEDRGAGIPEEALESIFERFERAPGAGATPGLGLGLWIVRQIVERHGGEVHAESHPGGGSTFTVSLPLEVCC